MLMLMDLHPTVIRWEDTTNIAAWSTQDELMTFAKDGSWMCENIGWVVYEDDACVVVAGRRTVDMAHLGLYERIPKRSIISRTPLS